jgi:kinesin family protein 5
MPSPTERCATLTYSNAKLTVPKAKHIPYRDSKLTRILQESLGGNSRTTLIINCSPSSYNEAETLGTLRFGIRAKSIKNTARVNAELSPLELKSLLGKAQLANSNFTKYIAALEAEVAIWRSGGTVDESEWAAPGKPGAPAPSKDVKKPSVTPSPSSSLAASRSMTPVNPAIEGLRSELESRPQTPTVIGLDKDEREEFLRRENELSDSLAERESALATADKLVKELKEELTFLKEQEASVNKVSARLGPAISVAHYFTLGKPSNVQPDQRVAFAGGTSRLRQQGRSYYCRYFERAESRCQGRA